MKLSICVITMNRAAQLKEALESCLFCELPKETEFVVIDNASSDDTEQTVHAVLGECGYSYYYEKLPENIGAGAGRNFYFDKAHGEFIYGMDDDAVIDFKSTPFFFTKAIEIMEKNSEIGSLATQIFDTAWNRNRQEIRGPQVSEGVYECKMFCGGSHFLRKSFFDAPPYFANKYGYEELPPSLQITDAGGINAFCPKLISIHKPMINKWDISLDDGQKTSIISAASYYAICKMTYPSICKPVLWLAMKIRFHLYLRTIPNAKNRFRTEVKAICKQYPISRKIKLSTVCKMAKTFKLSAF